LSLYFLETRIICLHFRRWFILFYGGRRKHMHFETRQLRRHPRSL